MKQQFNNQIPCFLRILQQKPSTVATVCGSEEYTNIKGKISFFQTNCGVLVMSRVTGLPKMKSACKEGIYALHIHSGCSCTGNENDPFADALTHYNPTEREHPYHPGDLLPLWGNNGCAFQVFLTDRFCVKEVIGKAVIIHLNPDDFKTQPAGNAGKKIACGIIR